MITNLAEVVVKGVMELTADHVLRKTEMVESQSGETGEERG